MDTLLRDLRVGFRSLRQRPAFLAIALATLALGIGASTAIFSVIEAALLRPLPFHDAGRLAMVWGVWGPDREVRGGSPIEIADWRDQAHTFDGLSIYDETTLNLSGDGAAVQLEAETVSPGFFALLGVAPVLGRAFHAEDDRVGAPGVAVISDDLWNSRYGSDAGVIGKPIDLDGQSFTIVGVMPLRFKGLSFDTDIWTPLAPFLSEAGMQNRGQRWLGAVARLRPGASFEAAQADLDAVARRLAEIHPQTNEARSADVIPLRSAFLDSSRSLLLVLLAGVALLLLIACANVANLQLVRTSDRERELSLRHALGASRRRVIRQLLTESLLLSALGALAGVFVASFALSLLLPLVPEGALPLFVEVRLDPVALGFAATVALAAGALLGLLPALRSDASPARALKDSRSSAAAWRPGRVSLQQIIVGGEIAFAVVLVAAAGLAIRSFRSQLAIDPGFEARGTLGVRVSLPDRYDDGARLNFVTALLEDLAATPGVSRVAAGSNSPLRGASSASILQREGFPDDRIRYYRHSVTPDYFETLRIPITRGRAFSAADAPTSPGVAIVSEILARRFWPDEDPIGKRLRIANDFATVIGVAANVHFRDLTTSLIDPAIDPDVYFAFSQVTPSSFDILLRDGDDPTAFANAVRRAVTRLDTAIPVYAIAPMARSLAAQTALGRLSSFLLGLFGWLSLILAAVGIFGVMSFIVRGRRREIAIRSAVGARPADIRRLLLRQGMFVVGTGLVIGATAALFAGRLLASLLYGVQPADPVILGGTIAVILLAGFLANALPALQAARVDPRTAMSSD